CVFHCLGQWERPPRLCEWGAGPVSILPRNSSVLASGPSLTAWGGPSCPLSPEQLSRIERNKRAALLRFAARNVPEGFGESWKKELLQEFNKPYFMKLMEFVALERKRYTVYPPPDLVFSWTQLCGIEDVSVVSENLHRCKF
uniref:Uracil-DNA glycosylase-like domain-containing protein n=1 Tax=Callorhinchus milii TaxID=7868 RepID=A0A4W3GPT3_CALMI